MLLLQNSVNGGLCLVIWGRLNSFSTSKRGDSVKHTANKRGGSVGKQNRSRLGLLFLTVMGEERLPLAAAAVRVDAQ